MIRLSAHDSCHGSFSQYCHCHFNGFLSGQFIIGKSILSNSRVFSFSFAIFLADLELKLRQSKKFQNYLFLFIRFCFFIAVAPSSCWAVESVIVTVWRRLTIFSPWPLIRVSVMVLKIKCLLEQSDFVFRKDC